MRKRTESVKNFDEVHKVLKRFIPPIRSSRGAYTLERMQKLMEFLGNPQNDYKVIHVAGTSGKTSTCYYVASLLKQSSKRFGLTVSPHIDEINERVQVNLRPLSEKQYCKEFNIFLGLVEKSKTNPTYFELLTAFAYWEFKRQACEYVVVEVGLGGLLDATNVITQANKVNVITDIGIDHEEVLGKTVAQIASQKAGIIKPYSLVICYEQDEEVMRVIREAASQQQADLHEIWPLKNSELPRYMPLFQRRNWYLAVSAYRILAERDGLADLTELQLEASTKTVIPARMETITGGGKTIIMDGSHNQQKLEALVRSLKHKYAKQKFTILISFATTKQARLSHCLKVLLPICNKLIITTFTTENQEKASIQPLKVVEMCENLDFGNWVVIDKPLKAYKQLIKSPGSIKVVTGSFYLLNHLRPYIKDSLKS